MAILTPTPADLKATAIYRQLLRTSTVEDGLAERVAGFVQAASPLLELVIAGPFREYTLHNPAHARKLVHLCECIVPQATLEQLSALECTFLIMSCFLHDMGMALTSTERKRLLESPEYADAIQRWPELQTQVSAAREKHALAADNEKAELELLLYQLQEAGLASLLRAAHATAPRYSSLLGQLKSTAGRADLFSTYSCSFEQELIDICVSHNLPASALMEQTTPFASRFPRTLTLGQQQANTQYCAAVLRLADILDFDRERTPKSLFEAVGISSREIPGASVSLREWNKHMSVHALDFRKEEVVIAADCEHPSIEQAVRAFASTIEQEVKDTIAVTRYNPPDISSKYVISVPSIIRTDIRARGYVFKELSFRLDEAAIVNLLMGEKLYASPFDACRELVQNAVDACRARSVLSAGEAYAPAVSVGVSRDAGDREWIVVEDNGIGMDEHVLAKYFFRVGASYYGSPEFGRLISGAGRAYAPIARFGIGMLSTFMIGDIIELRTKNAVPLRPDRTCRFVRIDGKAALAFVQEANAGPEGTRVRLRLRRDFAEKNPNWQHTLLAYLRNTVVRPGVAFKATLADSSYETDQDRFAAVRPDSLPLLALNGVEPITIDVGRWSESVRGRVILFFHRTPNGSLGRTGGPGALGISLAHPFDFVSHCAQNRATVAGFLMQAKKLSKALSSVIRVAAVVDIDVASSQDIVFDVARKKLVASGLVALRNSVRSAVVAGMRDMGVLDRMSPETRAAMLSEPAAGGLVPVAVLEKVQALVPPGTWPRDLHKHIASELGISTGLAYRALSDLLGSHRVTKPASQQPATKPPGDA